MRTFANCNRQGGFLPKSCRCCSRLESLRMVFRQVPVCVRLLQRRPENRGSHGRHVRAAVWPCVWSIKLASSILKPPNCLEVLLCLLQISRCSRALFGQNNSDGSRIRQRIHPNQIRRGRICSMSGQEAPHRRRDRSGTPSPAVDAVTKSALCSACSSLEQTDLF